MSEDKTTETKDPRSFEERVFARFDVVEGRLSNVEIRIGKLEDRQYDTKPIWEQALAAIAENNQRMREGFDEIKAQLGVIVARLDAMDDKFKAIDERFNSLDKDLDNNFHGVERKIDVLNRNILELRADQRYVDSRLEKIESQAKPS